MDDREEALAEMHKATRKLIALIELEKREANGGPRGRAIERALVDIHEAWEEAKRCEMADEPD